MGRWRIGERGEMRKKVTSGSLSAHAISGVHVVLLGIDMEEGAAVVRLVAS